MLLSKSLNHLQIGAISNLVGNRLVRGCFSSRGQRQSLLREPLTQLPPAVKAYVDECVTLCQPDRIQLCNGSQEESQSLLQLMRDQGMAHPLTKYENCWLVRTNPKDVARVESRTFICTAEQRDAVPVTPTATAGLLGNWISPENMNEAVQLRFPGVMKGRTMYIIPFSMGPVASPLAKIGIEITDSPYVVESMKIMTRAGSEVLQQLSKNDGEFVKCLHSVGLPETGTIEIPSWPCDPKRTIILHKPASNEIVSYGSGYGGNSLLGKKCFALRIGCTIARREGWLAEHMLILGVTNPNGKKIYIAAAFPSACGKTNLAMMTPTLPGYKIECVGDDIAWMKFDKNGTLRAINPENGFFGVAPQTSMSTNPIAMKTIFRNTIFTNVAFTSEGGVYWEGMDTVNADKVTITDWLNQQWTRSAKTLAAHPNSRFCTPAKQCPIIDAKWDDPAGVPISAILFGGRRPSGVPLVYEAYNWEHGVFMGAAMRSEATAAAEHKAKVIMHDPFAMRPFFGYNFGDYLEHWLGMKQRGKVPQVFHVNWFRKNSTGQYLWPGFGDNSRVLDWIFRRVEGEECYKETAIGRLPSDNAINMEGLDVTKDLQNLFEVSKPFWQEEIWEIEKFFQMQIGDNLPQAIWLELQNLKERVNNM